jgi:2-succinyl-5-enolpyruvyl-6-hydroxy-3-cyclohexene-1-carboxylate synthase
MSDLSSHWSALIIETVVAYGVEHFCLAPGSRSGALAIAAAQHPRLRIHVHVDERSLGFFALGLSKASRKPVVVLTTSGTAVANVLPAVIEASQCETPLIILTADRPPELIGVGANQAINQENIYGKFVRKSLFLSVPSDTVDVRDELHDVFSVLDEGPVHINCPFREPFMPTSQDRTSVDHVIKRPCLITPISEPELWPDFSGQGVIVVGYTKYPASPEEILALSKKTGWPILADVQSCLRYLKHDQIISSLPSSDMPLLIIGGWFVARRLLLSLKANTARKYQLCDTREPQNPFGNIDYTFKGPISLSLKKIMERLSHV